MSISRRLAQMLTGSQLLRRLLVALLIGVLLNLLGWTLGYLFLPEGFLRGKTLAGSLPIGQAGGVLRTLAEIFLFNLLVGGGAAAAANLFRVGNLPLGYVYAWGNWVLFGLFLGTDSFTLARGARQVPSLLNLLQSSGFYEIGAYTLIAAATVNLFLYRQKSWLNWHTEKERNWSEVRLTRREIAGLLSAVALLLGANIVEAFSIVERLA